nr:unnamed protein product [Naegleria fowleri]
MDIRTTATTLHPADEDQILIGSSSTSIGAAVEGIQKTIESTASVIGEEISGSEFETSHAQQEYYLMSEDLQEEITTTPKSTSSSSTIVGGADKKKKEFDSDFTPFKPIHSLRFFGTILLTYYLWIVTIFHHGQFIYPHSLSTIYPFVKDQLLKPILMYALPSDYTCIWMYSLMMLWCGLQTILATTCSPSYHMYHSFVMNIFMVFMLSVTHLLPLVEWYEHFIALFTCSLVGGWILTLLSKTSGTMTTTMMTNSNTTLPTSTTTTTTTSITSRISLPSIDMGYNLWFILSLSVLAKQFELYEYISYTVACQWIATFLICNYMIQLYMNSSVMGAYDGENDWMDVLDKSVVLPFFNTIPLIYQMHQGGGGQDLSTHSTTTTIPTTTTTFGILGGSSDGGQVFPLLPITLFLLGYYIWSISNTQYMYFKQEYYFHGTEQNRPISSFPYFLLSKTLTPRVVSSRDGSYILADSGWLLCRNIDLSGELLMVWSLFLLNVWYGGSGTCLFIPLLYAMMNTLDIITTERNRHLYYSRQYAQDWTRYCIMVPYSLVPFVY